MFNKKNKLNTSFSFLLMVRHRHTQGVLTSNFPMPINYRKKLMETKKTWEYVSLAPIPIIRLSHCPQVRISNVKPAHASDDISIHHGMVNP